MTGRRESKSVTVALIELAGTALVLWLMAEDEKTVKPKLWLAVMHGSQRLARLFGRIAIKAEVNYRKEVQP
jgi:hypothetical protein